MTSFLGLLLSHYLFNHLNSVSVLARLSKSLTELCLSSLFSSPFFLCKIPHCKEKQHPNFARILLFASALSLIAVLLTLSHTFVSPNGLGVFGGKARLLYLAKGFPSNFWIDERFAPFQPAYPPALTALALGPYLTTSFCGEFLTQLITLAFFIILFVVGYSHLSLQSNDSIGWLLIGLSGWVKTEGLIFTILLWISLRIVHGISHASFRNLLYSVSIPILWHLGGCFNRSSFYDFAPFYRPNFNQFFPLFLSF